MSTTAKVFLGIIFVLSIVFVTLATALFSIRTNWRDKHNDLQDYFNKYQKASEDKLYELRVELDNSKRSDIATKKELASTVESLNTANETVGAQAQTIIKKEDTINKLNANLVTQAGSLDIKDKTISQLNEDKDSLLARAKQLQKDRDSYLGEMQNAIATNEESLSRLNRLNKELEADILKIEELEEMLSILRDKGVRVDELVANVAPQLDAKILRVDTALNLVMISIGSQDGVRSGYKFYAHRYGQFTGTFVIDKVEIDASFGRIVSDESPEDNMIKAGDNATTHLGG